MTTRDSASSSGTYAWPYRRQALLVAHGQRHRLAQGDAHVLDGVVAVDVQVADGVDVEVDQPVASDLVEHVVEEADARLEPGRRRCRRG